MTGEYGVQPRVGCNVSRVRRPECHIRRSSLKPVAHLLIGRSLRLLPRRGGNHVHIVECSLRLPRECLSRIPSPAQSTRFMEFDRKQAHAAYSGRPHFIACVPIPVSAGSINIYLLVSQRVIHRHQQAPPLQPPRNFAESRPAGREICAFWRHFLATSMAAAKRHPATSIRKVKVIHIQVIAPLL